MKTLKITEEAWKILSEYKLWSNSKSFTETVEMIDKELQAFLPKDSILKRESRV